MNKPEWMLSDEDDNHLYELLTLEDVFADQKIIARFAQGKLLEYLRSQCLIDWQVADPMIKQLEEHHD